MPVKRSTLTPREAGLYKLRLAEYLHTPPSGVLRHSVKPSFQNAAKRCIAALTGGYVTRLGPLVFAGAAYMRTQWPGDDGKYTIEGYNLFGDSLMHLNNLPL